MPGANLLLPPSPADFVCFPPSFGQRFLVTVDVEEEFDWTAPFDRERHSLVTIPALAGFQRFCEQHGVAPSYLIDYPVACSPLTVEALGKAVGSGLAHVGAQLHPWVSPPHGEEVNPHNSYAGNLPPELERAKIRALASAIADRFGVSPLVYRAGRYGVGANTATILAEEGFRLDTSTRPHFDYSPTGGPDYLSHPLHPYWINREAGLLEVPLTTVLHGPLRAAGAGLRRGLGKAGLVRGALARTGLLERIPLTPEGISPDEAVRGIDRALADGLPVLVLSFHSPSLAPGHTPYVHDSQGLGELHAWWRKVFAHLRARGIAPTSSVELLAQADLASGRQRG